MTGMAAWGTMSAVIAGGSRIGAERSVGWTRQMRTTPLSSGVYFATKVLCGYLLALLSIACLYIAGISLGVRLSGEEWLTMTALILIGLIPFAVLGILLGHVLTVDSMGPAMGGITALLALFGVPGVRSRRVGPPHVCPAAAVVLARSGGRHGTRRRRMAAQSVDRDDCLDRGPCVGEHTRLSA